MLKKRLIPVLLLQNGFLVRSERFDTHQIIGTPIYEVQRFNEWNVDELIYLDISRDDSYDLRRDDHKLRGMSSQLEILDAVSKTCFMPLTWGGRIETIESMRICFQRGADKVAINSAAVRKPLLISEAAKIFGSQAVVVSIDIRWNEHTKAEVYVDGGRTVTGLNALDWAHQVEDLGAGEILLQNIDRDGLGCGYDLDLIHAVSSAVQIPVIACSGVGDYAHYIEGINAGASAVAAANIFHFKELSDRNGKRALARAGINVRI